MNYHTHQLLDVVREHIPLEQGLRLQVVYLFGLDKSIVREHIPLEQGLRLSSTFMITFIIFPSQRAYSIRTRIKTHSLLIH